MIRSLIVLVTLGLASIASATNPKDSKPDSVIGTKAPAPNLTALDGKAVNFDTLRGKTATVVVFTSFECPVSNSYAELLNEIAKNQAEKGVKVVLVCPTSDSPEAVAKASAGFKLMMPVVLDSRKELAAGLQARTTPEAFVLDGEGMVRYRGRIDNAYSARLKRNPIDHHPRPDRRRCRGGGWQAGREGGHDAHRLRHRPRTGRCPPRPAR